MGNNAREPKWKIFDLEWYCHRYKNFFLLIEDIYQGDVLEYHSKNGCKIGNSPNPYFDEKWYLAKYPEIRKLIKEGKFTSGFDHYCQEGFKDHSPHWLFSETYYKECNPQLEDLIGKGKQFVNGYDHYLQVGDRECLQGSYFFNPYLYLSQKENAQKILEKGPFQYVLTEGIDDFDTLRLSWFFDPKWYFLTYFKENSSNLKNNYINTLCHYLMNSTPTSYSPLAYFSEQFYFENYQDLSGSILENGHGLFRNGYDHFLICGCEEQRKANADFNYDQFSDEVIALVKNGKEYHNVFEYWVAQQTPDLLNQLKNFKNSYVYHSGNSLNKQPDKSRVVIQDDPDISNETIKVPFSDPYHAIQFEYKHFNNPDEKCVEKHGLVSDSIPIWQEFDEHWYIRNYTNVTLRMKALEIDSIEEFYQLFGCFEGHSPNPYFDEVWYLKKYPEVKQMIDHHKFTCGFDHYCKKGYHSYDPHWLFSESFYKKNNPHLTEENLAQNGFYNGYDHYLKVGDLEGNCGSLFFDSHYFVGQYHQEIKEGLSPYQYYLKYLNNIDKTLQVSWYFDPQWYAQVYSDIKKAIEAGKVHNYLHHYLVNEQPFNYNPNAWFDEKYYQIKYQNQLQTFKLVQKFRNGYDHFIHEGIKLLWSPCANLNLQHYALDNLVKKDIQDGVFPNAYVRWLAKPKLEDDQDYSGPYLQKRNQINIKMAVKDNADPALWEKVDVEWYLKTYPDTKEKMESCGLDDIETYYYQIGSILGHSPNPYFDEEWYLKTYSELRKNIDCGAFKSGFDHYCKKGYLTNDPHWLFSTHYYLKNNPDFLYEIINDNQYVNAYDHYLKKGDELRRTGSLFFDPLVYQRACYQRGKVKDDERPYKNFLYHLKNTTQNIDTSFYFDTLWYLEQYPDVRQLIVDNEYHCALHHYCVNDMPRVFNPSPWFEEDFYLQNYSDIRQTIESTSNFRNGYDHFIHYGVMELRSPHPDIDLKKYFLSSDVRENIENKIFRDAYACYVFNKRLEAWMDKQPDDSYYRLSQRIQDSRACFRQKSKIMLPTVAHRKLDFSYHEKADISVIMLMHNNFSITLTALSSLRANFHGKIQLLLGDNHSTDDSQYIQNCLIGALVTRFPYNFGFGKACNELIKMVDAPIVIFLNNDIHLYPGAIDVLCQRLTSSDRIGAVGGKIVHPDGGLQEAGQIIWRDGTTSGYLRGEDPSLPEANFVRDVDYCSASMLAVKNSVLQELEGFSPLYYPAYYEDTDLCVRIIKAGYRIIYEPNAVVEHMEYCSSDPIVSNGLIQRNHRLFVKEHADFLRYQHPRHSENVLIARQRKGQAKKILFIEDRVPLKYLGSGYVRSNDIIHQMAELGYEVTVYPINYFYPHLYQIYSSIPDTVEVLFNHTIEHLRDFLKERAGYYDVVWIGRTHNLNRILPMMGEASRYLPQSIILDTEVVATPRTRLHDKLLGREIDQNFDEAIEEELSSARHCQEIVAVNEIDAGYIKNAGFDNVNILGHCIDLHKTTKPWKDRKNILFVGALHDDQSPNYDSLKWFLEKVMPILTEKMDESFFFSVVGYVNPSIDISFLINCPNVKFWGMVPDLTQLYDDHRVYVAPTRFAGGIPYKLHEAASYGIPIVASNILVEQLGWQDEKDILAALTDDPEFFASQIIRLYQTEVLWDQLRDNALNHIEQECDHQQFKKQLQAILSKVF